MITFQYYVSSMRCAGCIRKIESSIQSLEVASAFNLQVSVNLIDHTVTVQVQESAQKHGLGIDRLQVEVAKCLDNIGYSGSLISSKGLVDSRADDMADIFSVETEQKKATKFYWMKGVLALAVGSVLFVMGWMDALLPPLLGPDKTVVRSDQVFWLIVALICLVVMIVAGRNYYVNACKGVIRGHFSMDSLISLGTGAAWVYSLIIVLFPHLMPDASRHLYFDTSVIILGFINIGRALESRTQHKLTKALYSLISSMPKMATVIIDGTETQVAIKKLKVGDLVRVKATEQIPVDGVIVDGSSRVDQSSITGEPVSVRKKKGDQVYAGSINQMESFIVKVEKAGDSTVIAKISETVKQAQMSKPQIGKQVDRITQYFVPLVLVITLVTVLVWSFVAPEPKLSYILTVGISVLVIACPCALGLATPLALVAAVGQAAKRGLLIRNGQALQNAEKITHVVFDKTGTLTRGQAEVSDFLVLGDISKNKLCELALALSSQSVHPLGDAIVEYAQKSKTKGGLSVVGFKTNPGKGLEGKVGGKLYYLGSKSWMKSMGIEIANSLEKGVGSYVYLANKKDLLGVFRIKDALRDEAGQLISDLKKQGIEPVLLSGDQTENVKSIANDLGIKTFYAEVLPDKKREVVQELQKQGHKVAMVGDGINDAPALAVSDLSIAMNTGSDLAICAADITLMNSDLNGVLRALSLSKATMRNIRQNLFWAMIYNVIGIPIAAGVFFPFTHILLSPVVASLAMALSSLTVVFNALRLKLVKV